MMRCEEVQTELARALDGDPESLAALYHVKLCEPCAAVARELAGLDAELHETLGGIEEAPPGFVAGVLSRLPGESPEVLARRHLADRVLEVAAWVLAAAALWWLLVEGGLLPETAGWLEALVRDGEALARETAASLSAWSAWLASLAPASEALPFPELETWMGAGGVLLAGLLQRLALAGLETEGVPHAR